MTDLVDLSQGAEETYQLTRVCYICKEKSFVLVCAELYRIWDSGHLIQNVWPNLTPAQREMIKLGYHDDCWEETFGSGKNDDEESDEDDDWRIRDEY
jgi:hypothetical protein